MKPKRKVEGKRQPKRFIISLRLDQEVADRLVEISADMGGVGISNVIRLAVSDFLKGHGSQLRTEPT